MHLHENIIVLIRDEQAKQAGNFVPVGDEYLKKLADKAELLVHESSNKCLGLVFFYCNEASKHSSYITLLLVASESRNLGIGAALVRYVLTLTVRRGFKVCRLEVRKENIAALKLYKTLGFCEIEDRGDKLLMEAQAN